MKQLSWCFLLIVLLAHSPVHAGFYSVTELNKHCAHYLKSDRGEEYDRIHLWSCMSYVAGVYDMLQLTKASSKSCVPSAIKLGQVTTIAATYIRDNPKLWHKSAAVLVMDSIHDAFPCS